MDYKKAAQQVLDNIGGASNIVSAAHCATRLRLVIADNSKVNKKELENAEGAKGVFEAQGQLQIIFGTGIVNKVYDEFTALAGITGASKEEVKQAAAVLQHGVHLPAYPDRLLRRKGVWWQPVSGCCHRHDHDSPQPAERLDRCF